MSQPLVSVRDEAEVRMRSVRDEAEVRMRYWLVPAENFSQGLPNNVRNLVQSHVGSADFYLIDPIARREDLGPNVRSFELTTSERAGLASLNRQPHAAATGDNPPPRPHWGSHWIPEALHRERQAAATRPPQPATLPWRPQTAATGAAAAATDGSSGSVRTSSWDPIPQEWRTSTGNSELPSLPVTVATSAEAAAAGGSPAPSLPVTAATSAEAAATEKRARRAQELYQEHATRAILHREHAAIQEAMENGTGYYTPDDSQRYYLGDGTATGATTAATSASAAQIYEDSQDDF